MRQTLHYPAKMRPKLWKSYIVEEAGKLRSTFLQTWTRLEAVSNKIPQRTLNTGCYKFAKLSIKKGLIIYLCSECNLIIPMTNFTVVFFGLCILEMGWVNFLLIGSGWVLGFLILLGLGFGSYDFSWVNKYRFWAYYMLKFFFYKNHIHLGL